METSIPSPEPGQAPLPKLAPEPRRHDLDALRAAAMLLGIALHAALSFVPGIWMVQDTRQNEAFGLFIAAVHGFRMPLFFLLSGFFTAMLWRRRGLKSLLLHRFKRIFLPLLLGMVTIIPAVNWVTKWAAAKKRPARGEPARKAPAGAEKVKEIWTAARLGDVAAIRRFAENGVDVNAADPVLGSRPLVIAALYGQDEAVEALLRAGADPNAANKDGGTALHAAAFLGYPDIVKQLLEAGADPALRNNRGDLPQAGLDAPWMLTRMIADLIKLKIDKDKVLQGREKCREIFARYERAAPARDSPPENAPRAKPRKPDMNGLAFLLFVLPVFHHLWFLWFLCWLVAGFAIYALIANALKWKGAPQWLVASPLNYLWLIPLTMIPQWFMGRFFPTFGPDTSIGLLPMPHVLLYYAIFFGFGALYYDARDTTGRLGRWWMISMPLALLVIFPLGLELTEGGLGFRDEIGDESVRRPLAVFLQVAYAWTMSFACIGLFRALLPRENPKIRYLSDSAYWLYIAHVPLMIWAQAIVRDWPLPALLKCALICAGVTAFLLLTYRYLVRYTWLGRLLNGPRTRPERTSGS